jgi:hypothetical protein
VVRANKKIFLSKFGIGQYRWNINFPPTNFKTWTFLKHFMKCVRSRNVVFCFPNISSEVGVLCREWPLCEKRVWRLYSCRLHYLGRFPHVVALLVGDSPRGDIPDNQCILANFHSVIFSCRDASGGSPRSLPVTVRYWPTQECVVKFRQTSPQFSWKFFQPFWRCCCSRSDGRAEINEDANGRIFASSDFECV